MHDMDKLCDKMDEAMARSGMGGRKVIASGELESVAGKDGHGPRESGKFTKPKATTLDTVRRGRK